MEVNKKEYPLPPTEGYEILGHYKTSENSTARRECVRARHKLHCSKLSEDKIRTYWCPTCKNLWTMKELPLTIKM